MKTLRNIYNSNLYNTFNSLPKNPKIVLFGTPNVDKSLFAHRLAIDAKIPVISIQKILNTLISFEDYYSTYTFYRKILKILKNPNKNEIMNELEINKIPEKLIELSSNSEDGYILYDYPNTLKQAQK